MSDKTDDGQPGLTVIEGSGDSNPAEEALPAGETEGFVGFAPGQYTPTNEAEMQAYMEGQNAAFLRIEEEKRLEALEQPTIHYAVRTNDDGDVEIIVTASLGQHHVVQVKETLNTDIFTLRELRNLTETQARNILAALREE